MKAQTLEKMISLNKGRNKEEENNWKIPFPLQSLLLSPCL